jgi:hypothetical protein
MWQSLIVRRFVAKSTVKKSGYHLFSELTAGFTDARLHF